jgi:hypothetical protein
MEWLRKKNRVPGFDRIGAMGCFAAVGPARIVRWKEFSRKAAKAQSWDAGGESKHRKRGFYLRHASLRLAACASVP